MTSTTLMMSAVTPTRMHRLARSWGRYRLYPRWGHVGRSASSDCAPNVRSGIASVSASNRVWFTLSSSHSSTVASDAVETLSMLDARPAIWLCGGRPIPRGERRSTRPTPCACLCGLWLRRWLRAQARRMQAPRKCHHPQLRRAVEETRRRWRPATAPPRTRRARRAVRRLAYPDSTSGPPPITGTVGDIKTGGLAGTASAPMPVGTAAGPDDTHFVSAAQQVLGNVAFPLAAAACVTLLSYW